MSTDWTTTADCDHCNEHGPFLPGGAGARDLHAAWHGFVAEVLTAFARVLRANR
jgi:hypothetical protein